MFRFLVILALSLSQQAHAHGLHLSLIDGSDAVVGQVTFADGTPLVAAVVELRRGNSEKSVAALAVTRTDSDGRYAFPAPTRADEYRVIADDGLGHRSEIVFVARGDQQRLVTTHTQPSWVQWLSGLGYLAGLFGITAWWMSRRSRTRIETP